MLLSIAVLGIPDNVPVTGILNQWYLGTSSSGLLPSITRNLAFFLRGPFDLDLAEKFGSFHVFGGNL